MAVMVVCDGVGAVSGSNRKDLTPNYSSTVDTLGDD